MKGPLHSGNVLLLALLTVVVSSAEAVEVFRFASSFGDHMVLQSAPRSASVYGFGVPGSMIEVSIDGECTQPTATVQPNGFWQVLLPPHPAGFKNYTITAFNSTDTIKISDVLFGDVYVCSGQSNMHFTLNASMTGPEAVKDSINFPYLRLFTPALHSSTVPLLDFIEIEQPWSVSSPAAVGGPWNTHFSALAFFFAREIFKVRNVPIGLIASNWGATPVEAWSSPEALKVCNTTQFEDTLTSPQAQPSACWNGMIAPLTPMTIFGVIWYQGEANCYPATASFYHCRFPAMIADWRAKWFNKTIGETDPLFPFGFVQLSAWKDTQVDVVGQAPIVRFGQTGNVGSVPNSKMPNTFMAVSIDLGDPASPYTDVHPRYKQQVGERLALAARSVTYNESNIYWTGPLFEKAVRTPTGFEVTIKNIGTQGLEMKHFDGFDICVLQSGCTIQDGGTWQAINATSIKGETIFFNHPTPQHFNHIRYLWRQAPCNVNQGILGCAVYAKAEALPLPPFYGPIN